MIVHVTWAGKQFMDRQQWPLSRAAAMPVLPSTCFAGIQSAYGHHLINFHQARVLHSLSSQLTVLCFVEVTMFNQQQ
jgi:hypothetical protein